MRILSLYIDAFGGLSKRSYEFSSGFSEILAENGAGKSTLAAFIKAMLYGLDGTGITKDLSANEFALYRPWSGGRFGGSLTFSTDTGIFRIERYFEDKRGANKHLGEWRVLDTATEMPTDAFGEEPGRVLLGVDGESFMRTAYLSSRGLMAAKTADISAKLGGLDGERWDMSNADEALRLIERRRTEIRTRTKQKHGTKLLDIAERELNTTRERIAEARAAMEAETRERETIAECEGRLAEQRTRLDALTRIKAAADRRQGEEAAKREQIAELSALLAREEAEITELSRHFPDAPPSPETLSALDADLGEYNHLASTAARREPIPSAALPSDADIAELRELVGAREEAKAALAALPVSDEAATGTKGSGKRELILGLIFLLLLPIGIFLLVRYKKHQRRAKEEQDAYLAAKRERERAEARLSDAEEKAAAALTAFGLARDAKNADIDALYARVLTARLAAEEQKRADERMALLYTRIEDRLSAYRGLPATDSPSVRIDALHGLCRRLGEKQALLVEHSGRLARLNATAGAPAEESPDTAEVEGMIAMLKESIAKDTALLAAARTRADGYRALSDALDELYDLAQAQSAEVERLTARLSVLDKTAAMLSEARDALEARCLGGIRGRITAYTDRLLGKKLGRVRLNTDLALSFSEGGEGHSTEYFSTGLRAIGDICLRLALTDELYPNDPPPLILDDPFMALDEENLSEALSLLAELAKARQIIYLTCHASRSGKGE